MVEEDLNSAVAVSNRFRVAFFVLIGINVLRIGASKD